MCMARANSGRSVGLLGHTQRKVLNLSTADQQRQRNPKGGHGQCLIRSIDWQKKGSLRASRYNRAILDQVLLCVLTGTSTKQIGNAQLLKQQPHSIPCLPQCVRLKQLCYLLMFQVVGRKANSSSTSLRFRSHNIILRIFFWRFRHLFHLPAPFVKLSR